MKIFGLHISRESSSARLIADARREADDMRAKGYVPAGRARLPYTTTANARGVVAGYGAEYQAAREEAAQFAPGDPRAQILESHAASVGARAQRVGARVQAAAAYEQAHGLQPGTVIADQGTAGAAYDRQRGQGTHDALVAANTALGIHAQQQEAAAFEDHVRQQRQQAADAATRAANARAAELARERQAGAQDHARASQAATEHVGDVLGTVHGATNGAKGGKSKR